MCSSDLVLVRHFVQQATPVDLQALADCIAAEEAARLAGDTATALRQSGHFHLLVADAAGHLTFAGFLRKLVSRTSLILMAHAPEPGMVPGLLPIGAAPAHRPRRWVQACRCDEHRGLLAALKAAVKARAQPSKAASTLALAEQLMGEHLLHIEASLRLDDAQGAA